MAILAKVSGKVVSISRPQNGDFIWLSLLQKVGNGRPELMEVGVNRNDDWGVTEDAQVNFMCRIDADRKEPGKLVAFYVAERS